jgi:hypothetical protein
VKARYLLLLYRFDSGPRGGFQLPTLSGWAAPPPSIRATRLRACAP